MWPARHLLLLGLLLVHFAAACVAPVASPTPSSPPAPTTGVPPFLHAPPYRSPTPGVETLTVDCATPDGANLASTFYGHGTTAVIFSNRSDKGRDSWASMASRTAAAGYLALTYDYRAFDPNGNVDIPRLNLANLDLRGAIACVKMQGALSIVLVGASIGGMASAKEAAAAPAAALVIIGSPISNSTLTLRVDPADLQTSAPKLFIASQNDTLVPASDTKAMYDAAAEPKTYYQYAGDAHGTDLLLGPFAEDFQQRILDFIKASVK